MTRLTPFTLLFVIASTNSLLADDITLKSGAAHKDLTLVKETEKSIEFLTHDGKKLTFSKNSIVTHERKPTARDEYAKMLKVANVKDASSVLEVAKFAKEKGLAKEAKRHFEDVVKLDPENAAAREGLGHKKVDAKWLNASEVEKAEAIAKEAIYKIRGFKKVGNTWVSLATAARLAAGLVEHQGTWVTKEQLVKIVEEKWEWIEGDWVTPADKAKMDQGQRKMNGKWTPIEDIEKARKNITDPLSVRDRHVEVRTNHSHRRAKTYAGIAEDAYTALAKIFDQDHPDIQDKRGLLLIYIGATVKDYQTMGGTFAKSNRSAEHSSSFGSFYAPEFESGRGVGCSYDNDDGWTRVWIGHSITHAFLDRLTKEPILDERLVIALCAYISATHASAFAPNEFYFWRLLNNKEHTWEKASNLLSRIDLRNEASLGQTSLLLHFLQQKNPEAFQNFWFSFVGGKGMAKDLLSSCFAQGGEVDSAVLDKEFETFRDSYRKDFKPWDK